MARHWSMPWIPLGGTPPPICTSVGNQSVTWISLVECVSSGYENGGVPAHSSSTPTLPTWLTARTYHSWHDACAVFSWDLAIRLDSLTYLCFPTRLWPRDCPTYLGGSPVHHSPLHHEQYHVCPTVGWMWRLTPGRSFITILFAYCT